MKTKILNSSILIIIIAFAISSCEKQDSNNPPNLASEVTGTYKGSFTPSDQPDKSEDAILVVTKVDDHLINIDLMSEYMDTTFMMNLYDHTDSIMVCFTGDRFNEEYGHHLEEGHHMMGDGNDWGWMHHIEEQHDGGDDHFGGFDMNHNTFLYKMMRESEPGVYYQFEGKRE